MKLADNVIKAMRMMTQLKEIEASLPGLDCGICGAPSCRALADDIVRGYADRSDCVFASPHTAPDGSDWVPAPFRERKRPAQQPDGYDNDFARTFLKEDAADAAKEEKDS